MFGPSTRYTIKSSFLITKDKLILVFIKLFLDVFYSNLKLTYRLQF